MYVLTSFHMLCTNILNIAGVLHMNTPFNVLNTPDKRRHMRYHRRKAMTLKVHMQRVTAKMERLQQESVETTEELSNNLMSIMAEEQENIQKLPDTSFRRTFWEQQVRMRYSFKHRYFNLHRLEYLWSNWVNILQNDM